MSLIKIKCVVWDLDNTLWNGILLEDKTVSIKPEIIAAIRSLDEKGILQSISSKNDFDAAIRKLRSLNLTEYFLYPQINWNHKSEAIELISKKLNLSLDTFAFIDDSPYEIDEVQTTLPQVRCFNIKSGLDFLKSDSFTPKLIMIDGKHRRKMYMENIERNQDEENFKGPKESFLKSLEMKLIISEATLNDLERAEELTERTNQLNSTGKTYSFNELHQFINNPQHSLYICELSDRYGNYGKIGLALIEHSTEYDTIKLLLMSCRVMSRGVGSVLLTFIMKQVKNSNKLLRAYFRKTSKNMLMYITYKFSNFKETHTDENDILILENDLSVINHYPTFIKITSNLEETIL